MRWAALVLVVGVGCSGAGSEPGEGGAEVRSWLEDPPEAGAGVLVVQTEADADLDILPPSPSADRLRFERLGDPRIERLGDRELVTVRYRFTGPAGHHEIDPVTVTWDGGEASTATLFVDLEVPAPRGELAPIAEPDPIYGFPWRVVAWVSGITAGVGALAGLGVWLWWRRRPADVETPPESPDIVALRAWDAVQRDRTLGALERSVAIAEIFRVYVEAVFAFPATAWTTREITDRLADTRHLDGQNVERAKRLLRATDLVKFADKRAEADLFVELDESLRAFVAATRPHRWDGRT